MAKSSDGATQVVDGSDTFLSSGMHFLVVDDLSTMRHIISVLLKGLGHVQVTQAENGAQALERLKFDSAFGAPIDFVVTDWKMPVMDGMALLQEIRASSVLKNLPVLMITAETENHSVAALMQAGADGYLAKFLLSASSLKEMLNSILMKKRSTASKKKLSLQQFHAEMPLIKDQ